MRKLLLAGVAAFVAMPAYADLFTAGSTFVVEQSNAPSTGNTQVTLGASGVLLSGAISTLTSAIVDAPDGNTQWLVFHYETNNGAAIGTQGVNWSINEAGLQANVPVDLVRGYIAFDASGVNQPASSGGPFGGFTPAANPVPGGVGNPQASNGLIGPVSDTPFDAGPLPALGTFIDPWNDLDSTGINSVFVTGYTEALEFTAQNVTPPTGVPEPATIALLGVGCVLLGAARRGRGNPLA